MDFDKEVSEFFDTAQKEEGYPVATLKTLLKKVYLAGARDVFREKPSPDNGWLHFQPKVAMLVTSRDDEEQQEQLLTAIKRMLGL